MKAIVLNKPGKPETLQVSQLPKPEPGQGEVRIKVHAVSLNPVDYKVAGNGVPSWEYPFVLGLDVAGVVDAVGEGVSQWSVGDRVVYHGDLKKPGGYAEYAITTAHTTAALPEAISFEEGAAFPCAGLTAYQAIQRRMNLQKGQSILIHGGAGGVGGYGIQIAKALGASKIITTASPANASFVQGLGADVVIDYHTENVRDKVLEATDGLGVDRVLSSINREVAQQDLELLIFGGQVACIAGMPDNVADAKPPTPGAFSVHKIALGGAHGSGNVEAEKDLAIMADEFMQLMLDKKIDPMVNEVIALEQIPEALARLSQRHVRGKIVVKL